MYSLVQILRELRTLVLGLLLTVVIVPIFVVVCLPIYCFRFIVSVIGPCVRPELGRILSARSSVIAWDDIYTEPRCTLLAAIVVEGDISLDHVREEMLRKVVNFTGEWKSGFRISDTSIDCTNPKSCLQFTTNLPPRESLAYPEFQQYCVRWLGFTFWKWDRNFSIFNHVNEYNADGEVVNEVDVARIRLLMVRKPFKENQSPWEMTIVRNFKPLEGGRDNEAKSVVILRVHHYMTDGYSLLQLFMTQMLGERMTRAKLQDIAEIPKPKFVKRNAFGSFIGNVIAVTLIPYRFVRNRLECRDQNHFHRTESELTRRIYPAGQKIPLAVVHSIRASHGNATFTAVLLSMITGGLRKYMLDSKIAVPKFIRLVTPLPRPDHPTKLRNYWSFCVVKLPVSMESAEERLNYCENYWQTSKGSAKPGINFALIPIIGSLPNFLMGFFVKNRITTAIMSNFPGPSSPADLFGHRVLDLSFGGGLGHGDLGLGFAILSYNGTLNLSLGADQSILKSQEEAQILMNCIIDEANALMSDAIV